MIKKDWRELELDGFIVDENLELCNEHSKRYNINGIEVYYINDNCNKQPCYNDCPHIIGLKAYNEKYYSYLINCSYCGNETKRYNLNYIVNSTGHKLLVCDGCIEVL